MIQTESPYDDRYLTELRQLRDEALKHSHLGGVRMHLGSLSFGKQFAEWQSRDDGCASLRDEGLRIGSTALTWVFPTVLKVFEGQATDTETLTLYHMDLRPHGSIAVENRVIYKQQNRPDQLQPYMPPATKRQLYTPSMDDLTRLYEEMKRGASGYHPPKKYNLLPSI